MAKIFITQFDYDRLQKLLQKRMPHDQYDNALLQELETASIVDPRSIPADVITMNSTVCFTDESGKEREYSVVFPEDADIASNKISVLSPIGCSLIGYRKGDEVIIPTPKGDAKLMVKEIVYQPERAGNFDA